MYKVVKNDCFFLKFLQHCCKNNVETVFRSCVVITIQYRIEAMLDDNDAVTKSTSRFQIDFPPDKDIYLPRTWQLIIKSSCCPAVMLQIDRTEITLNNLYCKSSIYIILRTMWQVVRKSSCFQAVMF